MAIRWKEQALCLGLPARAWIDDPEKVSPLSEHAMEVLCGACPVFYECADFADGEEVDAGFWAGRQRGTQHPAQRQGGAA